MTTQEQANAPAREPNTPGPKRPRSYDFDVNYEPCEDCSAQIKWWSPTTTKPGTCPGPMLKRYKRCADCAAKVRQRRTA